VIFWFLKIEKHPYNVQYLVHGLTQPTAVICPTQLQQPIYWSTVSHLLVASIKHSWKSVFTCSEQCSQNVQMVQDPEPVQRNIRQIAVVHASDNVEATELTNEVPTPEEIDQYFSGDDELDSEAENGDLMDDPQIEDETELQTTETIEPLRRGRPRRHVYDTVGDNSRERDIDDDFLRDPDAVYVDEESQRIVNGRKLTPLGIAWVAAAQLCFLLYVNEISDLNAYLTAFAAARDRFIAALDNINQNLIKRKGKLHLLYHVPRCVELYGPLRNYMTEMHERQNGEIRGRIGRTSRHDPSHDLHIRYQSECTSSAIEQGMYTYVAAESSSVIRRIQNSAPEGQYEIQPMQHQSAVQKAIQILGRLTADRKGTFSFECLRSVNIPRHVMQMIAQNLQLNNGESRIKLHELLKPATESSAIAKVNESWTTYNVQIDVDGDMTRNRIGQLKYLISNTRLHAQTVAIIRAFNLTDERDLGLNPILNDAHHWDVVDISNVAAVVNVQHLCTLNCQPVLQGCLRKDLRTLAVPKSIIIHDVAEERHVLNKHRLK
jgi:hypothetical protein